MRKNKEHVSLMQIEVWKMKDKVCRETKNMNSGEFFAYIKDKCRKLGYKTGGILSH